MSLISNGFLLFTALAAVIYYLLPKRFQWCGLLAVSLCYYAAGGLQYLGYLLFSAGITWSFALLIEKTKEQKKRTAFLILGLLLNLEMLVIVKYLNFIIENLNRIPALELPGITVVLPLGISFYVFQTSSYLIDVFRKTEKAQKNPAKYLLFASFFPQMVQGPISRWGQLSPQLLKGHAPVWENFLYGAERIVRGFFKKLVIADWAAVFVDPVFADPSRFRSLTLFAVLLYSIQLYANFSGGIDVVIGVASLFGIRLEENFSRPYFAVSIGDFWRRWHRTLSLWLKDYVYIPLGGSRCGMVRTCRNLLVTFLISGIWHGANWTYLIWGLLHGVYQVVGRLTQNVRKNFYQKKGISEKKWFRIGQSATVFLLVSFAWIFFRADSVSGAFLVIRNLASLPNLSALLLLPAGRDGTAGTPAALAILAVGVLFWFLTELFAERRFAVFGTKKTPEILRILGVLLLFAATGAFGSTALAKGFIYAQF